MASARTRGRTAIRLAFCLLLLNLSLDSYLAQVPERLEAVVIGMPGPGGPLDLRNCSAVVVVLSGHSGVFHFLSARLAV